MPQPIKDGPHKGKLLSQLSDREAAEEYRRITAPVRPPDPIFPDKNALTMSGPEYRSVLASAGITHSANSMSATEQKQIAGKRARDDLHREFAHRRDVLKRQYNV